MPRKLPARSSMRRSIRSVGKSMRASKVILTEILTYQQIQFLACPWRDALWLCDQGGSEGILALTRARKVQVSCQVGNRLLGNAGVLVEHGNHRIHAYRLLL